MEIEQTRKVEAEQQAAFQILLTERDRLKEELNVSYNQYDELLIKFQSGKSGKMELEETKAKIGTLRGSPMSSLSLSPLVGFETD